MSELKFIRDEEIQNLNGDDDLLETKKYANTLKEVIINIQTPFTIGLFGEWGSGKSSIVNTAQSELEKETTQKIKFIKYDAWKYANDSFRRMFLKTVQAGLNIEGSSEFEAFYIDKNTTTKIDKKINTSFLVISLIIILIGFISIFIMSDDTPIELKITVPLLITVIGMSVSIARNFFDSYKVTVQNPKIFAPEQFEDIFDEMIDSALTKTKITAPQKWIKGEFTENKVDKLVIIVDNIDRCDKETAYELLTNIKNFLEREGIVFVVPIDDSALRRHLKEKNNEDSKEADEFLRKFFNVTLKIKHFQSRDLFIFTNDLNKKYELNLQADTIDIIAKEYATNPRRIIQLLNNLISELNVVEQKYESDFVEENESLIAKLLIIREEWSCVYKQISEKPHILKNDSEILLTKDTKLKEDVLHFLKRTKAISENVNIQVIEKLTSNIDNDLKVSSEILEYINNSEYEKVTEYIADDENHKELIYYFIEEFQKELLRGTFKLGALNRFINIIKLNEIKEIPRDINSKLYREISDENILKVIENLSEDDFDSFYKFVDVNQKQNLKYLEKLVIKQYKIIWKDKVEEEAVLQDKAKVWTDGLDEYINNSSNTNLIKTLQEIFVNYYDHFLDSPLHSEKWINEDKLQYIVSNKLIDYLVDKTEESLESDSFKELLYFSELKIITIEDIKKLFTKLNISEAKFFETTDLTQAKKELFEDSLSQLKKINQLILDIPSSKVKINSIDTYFKYFNGVCPIEYQHPSYPTSSQYNKKTTINFVNEISDNVEYQKELLKLYIEVYRATYNETDIHQYIKALVTKYSSLETELFKALIKLRDINNLTLKPFFNYLIDFTNLNSDLFNLYEKLFVQENYLSSEKVKEKLSSLIQEYLTEENETTKAFLINMLQDNSIRTVITEIVTSLSTDNIILLPREIQQLTYDYLCDNDKLFDIEDKIEFIKEVLNFDKKYKDCVVNLIVTKLHNKAKVKGALEILESLKHPSAANKIELCSALKKRKNDKKYAEEIAKYMKKYCVQDD